MERHNNPSCGKKETSPNFKWVWDLMWLVISSAHNLITVIQTVRRKLHTTLNNICMVLTLTGIELELSESQYSICDVSTAPTRFSKVFSDLLFRILKVSIKFRTKNLGVKYPINILILPQNFLSKSHFIFNRKKNFLIKLIQKTFNRWRSFINHFGNSQWISF